jgi:hypothetical protein
MHARRQAANPPPSGTLGFVSATQIPDGGESYGQVQTAAFGTIDRLYYGGQYWRG